MASSQTSSSKQNTNANLPSISNVQTQPKEILTQLVSVTEQHLEKLSISLIPVSHSSLVKDCMKIFDLLYQLDQSLSQTAKSHSQTFSHLTKYLDSFRNLNSSEREQLLANLRDQKSVKTQFNELVQKLSQQLVKASRDGETL